MSNFGQAIDFKDLHYSLQSSEKYEQQSQKFYTHRIISVCEYIYQHLDQKLSTEHLSQVANFSKFHFHRQFSEFTGMSVFQIVQLLRLKRASYQLVFRNNLNCFPNVRKHELVTDIFTTTIERINHNSVVSELWFVVF